jgi:hypothetical protein
MKLTTFSRCGIAICAVAAMSLPAAAAYAQDPLAPGIADDAVGVYRGEITAGNGAGTRVTITVRKLYPDEIQLMSSRPNLGDRDISIKMEDGKLVTADGESDGTVVIDLTANPVTLEYSPAEGQTWNGERI